MALVVGRDNALDEGAAGKLDVAHEIAMPVNAISSIASMTKPVTSVAVMMLFDEGKLKLDDSVSKYLSGFDNRRTLRGYFGGTWPLQRAVIRACADWLVVPIVIT